MDLVPPIEHRIVEKRIPVDDETVNIPPKACGVTVDRDGEYYNVRYLSPVETNWDTQVNNNE